MVIRHPFLSFSLPTPMTERGIPFPFPFPHSFLYLYPGSVRLSFPPFPATFSSFPSLYLSLSLYLFFSSLSNRLFLLLPFYFNSPCYARFFPCKAPFTFFQGYRRVASSRTFPFRGYRPPDDDVPTSSFSGKTQAETTIPPRSLFIPALSLSPCHFEF